MPRASRTLRALALGLCVVAGGVANAQLFGDDEARKAILELRERVEANRRQTEAQVQRLSADFNRLNEETASPTRRALLDLSNRLEGLKQDVAKLTGQSEQLARDVADLQRQQKDALVAFDERLRKLEPAKVTVDGLEFQVGPDERALYDRGMDLFRQSQFDAAAASWTQLLQRHPSTAYAPSAWYWIGNAHYAAGKFREAMDAYRKLMALAVDHPRVPEARLAMANCQLELKDAKGARRTLEELVKAFPQSEAAATARDRLSRMR